MDQTPPSWQLFCSSSENLVFKLSAQAFTDQDKLLALISKLHPKTFTEIRLERIWSIQADNYTDMKGGVLQERVKEDWVDKQFSNPKSQFFCPGHPYAS